MFQDDGSSSTSSSVTSSSSAQATPMMSLSPSAFVSSPYPWLKELKSEDRGLYLIHLLLACANHVSSGSLENANFTLDQISQLASPDGDTMQRIAAYFTEALAERILKSWPGLYKALYSTKISSLSDEVLVRKLFYEFFPFLKAAFVITNQAIVEAMEGERMVHVIDLSAVEPVQWRALIQDLSARPEGPPHLRITGVHEHKEVLDQMALSLTEEAEKLDVPFQFNPIACKLEDLNVEKLRVKTGEALAISSVLQLHTLLAEDDDELRKRTALLKDGNRVNVLRAFHTNRGTICELLEKDLLNGHKYNKNRLSHGHSPPYQPPNNCARINGFLSALRGLSPKVMVVTDQDSNHNGPTLMERLSESLYFYAALFDCLESTLPRTSPERLKVEKMLLGVEIKDIIACEGAERKKRHEKLEKWVQRLEFAGFLSVPLSYYAMLQARRLLHMRSHWCDGYRIREQNGAVIICWQDRPLFSVSVWRCRR